MEEKVREIPHVVEASLDPINHVLVVKAHPGMVSLRDIQEFLKRCGVECGPGKTPHEMAHLEHEAARAHVPAPHDHHAMMEADMKRRFYVALLLTAPILILSPSVQKWFNYSLPPFAGDRLLLFALASAVVLYGGWVFFKGAAKALRIGRFDMNTLVTIAVLSGYLYSVGATFLFEAVDFYWEISTLVTFLLFGHWMEMKAVRGASGALRELVKLIPPTASLVRDGEVVDVETARLKVGDIVLVRPGSKVPIDGVVVEGETTVNESMITGESKPVAKKPGDEVIGGTINNDGVIKVKVTKTGEATALAQIIKLVQAAQASKPRTQKLADRAAHYLTLIAIIAGLATFLFWGLWVQAGLLLALTLTITVVVIACPHALGLAIPTVTSISTTMAAKMGILVKNAEAMERARALDVVVFDKTGTLTKGEFGVTDILVTGDWDRGRLLQVAASIERNSEHSIAKAITREFNGEYLEVKEFRAIGGWGVQAYVDGELVYVGNPRLMEHNGIPLDGVGPDLARLAAEGKTLVLVGTKGGLKGVLALADMVKPESAEAVRELKRMGVEVAMITGDNRSTAEHVGRLLGIDRVFAEVLPEDKANKVRALQEEGKVVAMVGDGINDAPALIRADVGVAIGAGTDVAIESADVVLIKNDPRDVVRLIHLSRLTMRKMKENLVWATGYNAVALPLAAGALLPLGVVLRPEWAALIMAASSIIVVANALLLKKAKISQFPID
jgi:Cu2+-exporting ATPase